MDSSIAQLLGGAAVGAILTLLGTFIRDGLQRKRETEAWVLEKRFAVYSKYSERMESMMDSLHVRVTNETRKRLGQPSESNEPFTRSWLVYVQLRLVAGRTVWEAVDEWEKTYAKTVEDAAAAISSHLLKDPTSLSVDSVTKALTNGDVFGQFAEMTAQILYDMRQELGTGAHDSKVTRGTKAELGQSSV